MDGTDERATPAVTATEPEEPVRLPQLRIEDEDFEPTIVRGRE